MKVDDDKLRLLIFLSPVFGVLLFASIAMIATAMSNHHEKEMVKLQIESKRLELEKLKYESKSKTKND